MLQQMSIDVVYQVRGGRQGWWWSCSDKSKNLLCGSGCVGCGKVAGVFVASLFSLLCKGLQATDTFSPYTSFGVTWCSDHCEKTGLFELCGPLKGRLKICLIETQKAASVRFLLWSCLYLFWMISSCWLHQLTGEFQCSMAMSAIFLWIPHRHVCFDLLGQRWRWMWASLGMLFAQICTQCEK